VLDDAPKDPRRYQQRPRVGGPQCCGQGFDGQAGRLGGGHGARASVHGEQWGNYNAEARLAVEMIPGRRVAPHFEVSCTKSRGISHLFIRWTDTGFRPEDPIVRLTLRTLLAYLDDTLEPAQAKIIGEKVAESEVAQELIERIKQATRRRRVGTPPASGPGSKIDPNDLAEYLDSVLPSEKLAEVEESILKDDLVLAEVAACHQILALFLGQPAEVPPTAKERMRALLKGQSARPARPIRQSPAPDRIRALNALPDDPSSDHDEADEALLLGMSSFRSRNTWLRRLAPVAAVLVLVALLGVALWQVIPHGGGPVARPGDTQQFAGLDSGKSPTTETIRTTAPQPTTPDTGKKDPPDKDPPDKQPIDKVVADKPSTVRKDLGKYVATAFPAPSVLLHKVGGEGAWQQLKTDAVVNSTDSLLSLPGYRSEVNLRTGVQVTLWGEFASFQVLESGAVLHVPAGDLDVDLTLDRGRVVLANQKASGAARARVRFHDEVWEITLKDNTSVCALELSGAYPPVVPFDKDGKGEAPAATLDLVCLQGEADVRIEYREFSLPALGAYRWTNVGGPGRPQKVPAEAIRWYTAKELADAPAIKETVAALKDLSKRLEGRSVQVALAEARKEAKTTALLTFSVIFLGSIDDLTGLISCLSDERGEVRYRAIETLMRWIGLKAANDQRLYKALQKTYTRIESEAIMDLLHGFPPEAWLKAETYDKLIEYLDHTKVAIRELAFFYLWKLPEGKGIRYNPSAPEDTRRAAYQKWKDLLTTGKLPPKPVKQ